MLIAQEKNCKVLLDDISGKYKGKCENGLANGKGKASGKDTYIGYFKNGLPHGKGKYLYANKNVFNGNWENGKKHGEGTFTYYLNGKKTVLKGFWDKDEYVGNIKPEADYRISSTSGIMSHDIARKKSNTWSEDKVKIALKNSFTNFMPRDLRIEASSGQVLQTGKTIEITKFETPIQIEISYTIMVTRLPKQCRFIVDILKTGEYSITLTN